MRHVYLILFFTLLLSSCASSSQGRRGGTRNIITAEEIAGTSADNAFEAIQYLRPHLLQYRGVRSQIAEVKPVVYVDNIRYGDIKALYNIQVTNIKEIRFLTANDATTFYGTGHMGGAFVITTK